MPGVFRASCLESCAEAHSFVYALNSFQRTPSSISSVPSVTWTESDRSSAFYIRLVCFLFCPALD